jgi:uncharacterized membrane protein YtjA (UPF0391 family)
LGRVPEFEKIPALFFCCIMRFAINGKCNCAFCTPPFPPVRLKAMNPFNFDRKTLWHKSCKRPLREQYEPLGERNFMLGWTLMFLLIALIAGVLGFTGIAGAAMGIAQIVFAIFLILFLVSLVMRLAAK